MSLFIGRIPSSARSSDLEQIFEKFGKVTRCDIKNGVSSNFGFVEYENKEDAEEAIKSHQNESFSLMGNNIVVEFAKGKNRESSENECFKCKGKGHWARDCPETRRRGRSRSPVRRRGDSRDRYRRDNSYDRGRRDRSPIRRRNDSRDRYNRGSRSPVRRKRSRSPIRRRSRSRSPIRRRSPRRAPSRSPIRRTRSPLRSPARRSSPRRSPRRSPAPQNNAEGQDVPMDESSH